MRAECATALLPHVQDHGWFFDTELLVLAERSGLRIHEVPVDWVDDPDSRVDVVSTALADLRGIARVGAGAGARRAAGARVARARSAAAASGRGRSGRVVPQALRFGAIGVLSHARLPAAVPAAAAADGRAGGEPHRAAAHRRREHRRQPAAHVRHPRRPRRRARTSCRAASSSALGLALTSGSLRCCTRPSPPRRAPSSWPCCVVANPARPLAALRAASAAGSSSPRAQRRPPRSPTTAADPEISLTTTATRRPPGTRPARGRRRPARARWCRGRRDATRAGCGRPRSRCSPAPALLYLWGLGASGWANDFYAAAAQAGTQSWKAFFFGSLDAGQLHHRRQAARRRCG